MKAAQNGDTDRVRALVESGDDKNKQDAVRWNSCYFSCLNCN